MYEPKRTYHDMTIEEFEAELKTCHPEWIEEIRSVIEMKATALQDQYFDGEELTESQIETLRRLTPHFPKMKERVRNSWKEISIWDTALPTID